MNLPRPWSTCGNDWTCRCGSAPWRPSDMTKLVTAWLAPEAPSRDGRRRGTHRDREGGGGDRRSDRWAAGRLAARTSAAQSFQGTGPPIHSDGPTEPVSKSEL